MLGRLASVSGDWAGEDAAVTARTKTAMGAESALNVRDTAAV